MIGNITNCGVKRGFQQFWKRFAIGDRFKMTAFIQIDRPISLTDAIPLRILFILAAFLFQVATNAAQQTDEVIKVETDLAAFVCVCVKVIFTKHMYNTYIFPKIKKDLIIIDKS